MWLTKSFIPRRGQGVPCVRATGDSQRSAPGGKGGRRAEACSTSTRNKRWLPFGAGGCLLAPVVAALGAGGGGLCIAGRSRALSRALQSRALSHALSRALQVRDRCLRRFFPRAAIRSQGLVPGGAGSALVRSNGRRVAGRLQEITPQPHTFRDRRPDQTSDARALCSSFSCPAQLRSQRKKPWKFPEVSAPG